jgi:hypothetical protein
VTREVAPVIARTKTSACIEKNVGFVFRIVCSTVLLLESDAEPSLEAVCF